MTTRAVIALLLGLFAAAGAAAQQKPIPTEEQVAAATKLVGEVFKKDYDAAKTIAQKRSLAQRIYETGKQSRDDVAAEFTALQIAEQIFADTGAIAHACDAAEEIALRFDTDRALRVAAALVRSAPNVKTPDDYAALLDQAKRLLPQLTSAGHFAAAKAIARNVEVAARKARDTEQVKAWAQHIKDIAELEAAHSKLEDALAALKDAPTDAATNGEAGKLLCLQLGQWERGLPMLALSDDKELQPLAERELRGASEAKERIVLADDWFAYGQKQTGLARRNVLRNALQHYDREVASAVGLTKSRLEAQRQKILAEQTDDETVPLASRKIEISLILEGKSPLKTALVAGRSYPDSLWAHPPGNDSSSIITIDLGDDYKWLSGHCAIHSTPEEIARPKTPLTFRIVGDKDRSDLWKIKEPLQEPGKLVPFRVDIRGQRKLTLVVNCPGESFHAWAIWVQPMLHK